MTPEGMVAYVNNRINDINKELETKFKIESALKGKNVPQIELTDEMLEFINKQMQQVQELENEKANIKDGVTMEAVERQQDIAIQKIMAKIGENVPTNLLDKLSAWRNISLLGNPKTIARNLVSNATFTAVADGTDVVGAGIDKIVSIFTGRRSLKAPKIKTQLKGMKKGLGYGVEDSKMRYKYIFRRK